MTRRVINLLLGFVVAAVCIALPRDVRASLISFDSEIGRSAITVSSRSESGPPASKARTVADAPLDSEAPQSLVELYTQNSTATGSGQSSPQTVGFSSCAMTDGVVVSASSFLVYRICETAVVLPSPHLQAMLRPPRS